MANTIVHIGTAPDARVTAESYGNNGRWTVQINENSDDWGYANVTLTVTTQAGAEAIAEAINAAAAAGRRSAL